LGACMTAQMISIHPRLKAFIALVEIRGGSETALKELNIFSGSAGGLAEKRNRMVHDPRAVHNRTKEVGRLGSGPIKRIP
jgi:hypothetical protein